MTPPRARHPEPGRRPAVRTIRLLVAIVVLGVALAATVVWIVAGPPHQPSSRHLPTLHMTGTADPTPSPAMPACSSGSVRPLVAAVLDWDTTAETRIDVVRRIARFADPAGVETPGLLTDLDGYLPTDQVWQQLAAFRTRQTAVVTGIHVPASWAGILRQDAGRLPTGAAAFTVTATRTRTGLLDGDKTASSSRVTFTLFVRCPTSTTHMLLLRLSRLGQPLP